MQIEFEHLSGLFGTPFFGGKLTLVERSTAFRRLPATPANLRLTSVRALHPRAKCTIVGLSRAG